MAYGHADRSPAEPEVRTTVEAREGVTGHNVRYVLMWSLGGAILVLALIYFVFLA